MIPFPDKKYEILYGDPAWDYSYLGKNFDRQFTKSKYKFDAVMSAKEQYPTMTNKEIMELPVQTITEKNSLLFLWVVSPHLKIGIQVMEKWGFEYKTIAFVWYKEAVNPGFYTMSECEVCLVGKKGSIPKPRGARNIKQFLSEKRTVHSKKPDEIRNRIMRMFPYQSKIELFARHKYPGWDAWGDEIQDYSSEIIIEKKGFFE
jgi:N6-adenosine-specific RNA methylase IME4